MRRDFSRNRKKDGDVISIGKIIILITKLQKEILTGERWARGYSRNIVKHTLLEKTSRGCKNHAEVTGSYVDLHTKH